MSTGKALVRSRLYRWLAVGFSYPTPDLFETFISGKYKCEGRDIIGNFPPDFGVSESLTDLDLTLADSSYEDYEARFIRLFDVGEIRPKCPLYEGEYVDDISRPRLLEEVLRFYRHFGLDLDKKAGDLPDHLIAELDFMHYLTFKESQLEEGADNPYYRAQRDFMERHLGQWIPQFYRKIKGRDEAGFFKDVAQIAYQFVRDEMNAF